MLLFNHFSGLLHCLQRQGWLFVLLVILVACGREAAPGATATPASDTVQPTPTAAVTPSLQPTPAETGTPAEAAATPSFVAPPPGISFRGVTFSYINPVLGDLNTAEIVPPAPAGPGPETGNPEMIRFLFDGPAPDFFSPQTPQIMIYPIAQYGALSQGVANRIEALNTLLAEQPAAVEKELPLLPLLNAAETFHAQLRYLDFQNGRGLRFLTQYDQALNLLTNETIFYTFQGVSGDGQYYVAAFFPVSASALPATFAEGDSTVLEDGDAWSTYLAETVQTLNNLGSSDFSPDLAQLDAIVQSLLVTPENFPSPVQMMTASAAGVSFRYHGSLANDVVAETIPAQTTDVDGQTLFYENIPDYTRFTFERNKVAGNPSTLLVRPIQDSNGAYYEELPPEDVAFYDALSPRLVDRPQPTVEEEGEGATTAEVQVKYIDFPNGAGVRRIMHVASSPEPEKITNRNLYYIFDGLSDDGRTAIRLRYAISAPTLEEEGELTAAELEAIEQDFAGYVAGVLQPLEVVAANEFTPDLMLLDEMVASLSLAEQAPETAIPVNPPDCEDNIAFVEDVTIPDGTVVNPGRPFTKTWRIQNIGTCSWTPNYTWAFTQGDELEVVEVSPIGVVAPGEEFDVSVTFVAPEAAGTYQSWWQLFDDSGAPIGFEMYALVEVAEEGAASTAEAAVLQRGTGPLVASTDPDAAGVEAYLDLDAGIAQDVTSADIQFVITGNTDLFYSLEPVNSSLLAVMGTGAPEFEECVSAVYATSIGAPDVIQPGNYLCVQTSEGRYAQVGIEEVEPLDDDGTGLIRVSFITWDS